LKPKQPFLTGQALRACPSLYCYHIFILSERIVAKKKKHKQKHTDDEIRKTLNQPWISMRSGVKIIAITSLGMAALTAWQAIPSKGWLEGILWGLLFGALIWAVFFGNIFINKLLRRK
jgi:hypothetical protein